MRIVIPAALPPTAYAGELAKILPDKAPSLARWLTWGTAEVRGFDAEEAGCTVLEAWQLHEAGYIAEPELPLGAGLGPLHLAQIRAGMTGVSTPRLSTPAAVTDTTAQHSPVWLAEFAHLALGADQAMLVPAVDIAPTLAEAQALLDAILPGMHDAGFDAELLSATTLRVSLPEGLRPALASPLAVAGHALRAWWQTDATTRPWRRLLTDIQMTWHAHPVNESREAAGQPTINALWLYGGASPWESLNAHMAVDPATSGASGSPDRSKALILDSRLTESARAGDWSAWLEGLAALEHAVFRPLSGPDGGPTQPTTLVLMGENRRIDVTLAPRNRLLRWLPHPNKDWKHWWSLPA